MQQLVSKDVYCNDDTDPKDKTMFLQALMSFIEKSCHRKHKYVWQWLLAFLSSQPDTCFKDVNIPTYHEVLYKYTWDSVIKYLWVAYMWKWVYISHCKSWNSKLPFLADSLPLVSHAASPLAEGHFLVESSRGVFSVHAHYWHVSLFL